MLHMLNVSGLGVGRLKCSSMSILCSRSICLGLGHGHPQLPAIFLCLGSSTRALRRLISAGAHILIIPSPNYARVRLYYKLVIATGKMDTKHPLRTLRPSAAASAKSGRVGSWGHRAHWQRPVLLV